VTFLQIVNVNTLSEQHPSAGENARTFVQAERKTLSF